MRILRDRRGDARDRTGAQARADLPQAPPHSRRAAARHRVRLGFAAATRSRAPRCPRRRRDAVRTAGGARARARARRGAVGHRRDPHRRLPRAGDGPFDKIASVGMYEHVGRPSSATTRRASRSCCGPEACSSTTGSRDWPRSRRAPTRSSIATSFPTASCTRSPRSRPRCRRPGSRCETSSRCASTTPDAAALAREPRGRSRSRDRDRRRRARTSVVAVPDRLGGRVRGRRHHRLPGARRASRRRPPTAAGPQRAGHGLTLA